MKIFITKYWTYAVLLAIILILAIVVTVVLLGKINQLNDEASELNNLVAVENQSHDDALDEIEAVKAENKAVKAENDELSAKNEMLSAENETLRQYQLTFDMPNGFEIAIDQRLEPELVALMKKHFDAIATGNLDEYKSTLRNSEDEYLLEIFENRKNTSVVITSISTSILSTGIIQNGGFFLAVSYKNEGKVILYADIGVTKKEGNWVIYDYD